MAKITRDIPKICVICNTRYMACLHESRVCSQRCNLKLWRKSLPRKIHPGISPQCREAANRRIRELRIKPPSRLGWHHSEETKTRISNSSIGKPKQWFVGRVLTEEHRKKISEDHKKSGIWKVLFRSDVRKKAIMASIEARPRTNFERWTGGKLESQWCREVFERDHYRCCFCGSAKDLTGHHKWPRRLRPDLKYEPSNGITLCRDCHRYAEAMFRLCEPQYISGGVKLAYPA